MRMQAAWWCAEGRPHARIAAELRVGLRQAEKWRRAWREGGAEALRSNGLHGRSRLDRIEVWKEQVWPQVELSARTGDALACGRDARRSSVDT